MKRPFCNPWCLSGFKTDRRYGAIYPAIHFEPDDPRLAQVDPKRRYPSQVRGLIPVDHEEACRVCDECAYCRADLPKHVVVGIAKERAAIAKAAAAYEQDRIEHQVAAAERAAGWDPRP